MTWPFLKRLKTRHTKDVGEGVNALANTMAKQRHTMEADVQIHLLGMEIGKLTTE